MQKGSQEAPFFLVSKAISMPERGKNLNCLEPTKHELDQNGVGDINKKSTH